MCLFSVIQVATKVVKEGRKVRYMQRYLKAWEHNPQFSGSEIYMLAIVCRLID